MHSNKENGHPKASFKLTLWLGVGVQVLIELPQYTNPLTAQFTMGTVHLELIVDLLQALVCHGCETWLVAHAAGKAFRLSGCV